MPPQETQTQTADASTPQEVDQQQQNTNAGASANVNNAATNAETDLVPTKRFGETEITSTPRDDSQVRSFVSGLEPTINRAKQALQPQEDSQLSQQRQQITQQLVSELDEQPSQAKTLEQARERFGVNKTRQKLSDIDEQIAQAKGEFDRTAQSIQDEPGQTTVGAEARLNPVRRQKAAELGALSSVRQALQGNLNTARDMAQRTAEVETADERQRIQNLQSQLEAIQPQLNEEQKRRTEATRVALDERKRRLQQRKEQRQQAMKLGIRAAKNGAPADVASRMMQADSPDKATEIGGEFIGQSEGGGFTLSEGEARFDAQGNRIASLGEGQAAGTGQAGTTPRANRNNNPGNLRFDNQEGATGQDKDGFAKFKSVQAGFQALKNDLQAKAQGGTATSTSLGPESSIQDLAEEYAPAEDGNNPTDWANNVASALGVSKDAKIGTIVNNRPDQMAKAVANAEGFEFGQSGQKPRQEYSKEVTAIAEQMKKDNKLDKLRRAERIKWLVKIGEVADRKDRR